MGYFSKLQVIQRGRQNRQYYLICPAPLAAALELEKGESLEWVIKDRHTLEIRRAKPADRSQVVWRSVDVEHLIEEEHPARAIWALSGELELKGFYAPIAAVEGAAGRTPWDPRLLVSLWVYAYSRGISSAREIARRCTHEPAFQWLCGLGEINHHTLSDFRVNHDASLRELFVQVLGVLSSEGLVRLERV